MEIVNTRRLERLINLINQVGIYKLRRSFKNPVLLTKTQLISLELLLEIIDNKGEDKKLNVEDFNHLNEEQIDGIYIIPTIVEFENREIEKFLGITSQSLIENFKTNLLTSGIPELEYEMLYENYSIHERIFAINYLLNYIFSHIEDARNEENAKEIMDKWDIVEVKLKDTKRGGFIIEKILPFLNAVKNISGINQNSVERLIQEYEDHLKLPVSISNLVYKSTHIDGKYNIGNQRVNGNYIKIITGHYKY